MAPRFQILGWSHCAALTAAIVTGLLVGRPEDLMWYVPTLFIAYAAVVAAHWQVFRLRKWVPTVILVYNLILLIMCAFVLLNAAQASWGRSGLRVSLFFENPNLLGASLVVSSVAAAVLAKRNSVAIAVQLLTTAALLFIGSRTSFVAALIALVTWSLWRLPRRVRVASFVLCILTALVLVFPRDDNRVRNELLLSDAFGDPVWSQYSTSEIEIEPRAVEGPVEGTQGTRLTGRSPENHSLFLMQTPGRAQGDSYYVASIYVRALQPSAILLNTTASSTQCNIDLHWTRCVTPPGWFDDDSRLWFRLQTIERNEAFDFFVWGAQMERGEEATAPVGRNLHTAQLSRIIDFTNGVSLYDHGRLVAFKAAWAMFLESPWAGHGLGTFGEWFRESSFAGLASVNHAHNAVLQLLAETGLLGLIAAAFLPLTILFLYRRAWPMLVPLFVALFVLNLADFTYFHAGVYYVFWLAVSAITSAQSAVATEP